MAAPRKPRQPKVSLVLRRPVSKLIAAKNMVDDLIYALAHELLDLDEGEDPPAAEIESWDCMRVPFGEVLMKHLDAYDQRGT